MKNKGVTLISLVITIIVILILVTVTVYNGANTVNSSKLKVFETKLRIMQAEVNNLYGRWKSGEINPDEIGVAINSSGVSSQAFSYTGKSPEGYRYYNRETINELNIEGVEGETYFVNVRTRSVISYEGFEYEGTTYYEITQFVNNLYNVEYQGFDNIEGNEEPDEDENEEGQGQEGEDISTYPKFDLSVNYIGNEKWLLNVHNIRYSGNINKWYVKYGLVDEEGKVSTWYTSDNYTFEVNKEGVYKVKIVNGNIKSKLKKATCIVTLANKVTKANYGDYVDYKIDLGINGDWDNDTTDIDDWRILYNDGENVFIIASDCIPNEMYDLDKIQAYKASSCLYRINWWSGREGFVTQDVEEVILNKFKSTKYTLSENNINSKCVSGLLNANNWEPFVNTDFAEYAIGSPTIEMLTDSWNELGFEGITVGTGELGYTTSGNLSFNCTDTNLKTLYSPHFGWYSPANAGSYGFYGYWLASPSNSEGSLWSGYCGRLTEYYYSNSANAVRPVVMLKANVLGDKDPETGVWNLRQSNLDAYYEKKGEVVFDGTNYIDTGIYLFSEANVNKDFEISFDIVARNTTGGQATLLNTMDESGGPYPGFVYRIESGDRLIVNSNGSENNTITNPSNNVSKVKIKRTDGKIYLNINDTTDQMVLDMKNLARTFDVPVTFGSSLNGSGAPQRFFKGTLANLEIKIYK